MWMFLGLIGLLAASSMVDVFTPGDAPDPADADEAAMDDPANGGDTSTPTGDLLADDASLGSDADDDSDTPAHAPPVPDEAGDAAAPNEADDGLPFHDASGDGGGLASDNWFQDEFLSSDAPPQDAAAYYVTLDDDGDQTAGGHGNDTLLGGAGDDWLDGQGGADSLVGGAGDDTMLGGAGADTVIGGAGNDSLVSGSGEGVLIGGSGNDVLIGGEDDDQLFGGADDDTLQGGWGDDVLVGGTGHDVLFGGAGDDTLFGFTPDHTGRDIDGADVLNAGDGDDVLVLGSGDIASGGAGADTFILGTWIDPDEPAQITDFDPETDVLSVAYNANGTLPEISTEYDAEAGGLRVLLDGELVAILSGIEALDADSVALMAVEGAPNR